MNIVNQMFTQVYEISPLIEFNSEWSNGTGYYDNAVKMVDLEPGETAKSFDARTNRRILMCGTRFGSVVVFDRFSNSDREIFVSNLPNSKLINELIPSGSMGERHMSVFTGGWNLRDNIGFMIEKIAKEFNEAFYTKKEVNEHDETIRDAFMDALLDGKVITIAPKMGYRLFLKESRSVFVGIGQVICYEVLAGTYSSELNGYEMSHTQYFPLKKIDEAIECLIDRMNSENPLKESNKFMGYTLEYIKRIK